MSTRSWGLVTAAPHEHLVHIRRGEVIRSIQGGSCFRLPGDAVALVDTSVRRLQFTADQVTHEKTGVQVTGLAVFRVVDPDLAWRVLDPKRPDSIADILREMCVGATRRLVANLSLQDCMTRRKEALATELHAEVAPVVRGTGRADDGTDRGWGIAIDTIEIQDVKILSEEVFSRLQAPYREGLALEALKAQAEVRAEEARLEEERGKHEEVRRRERMALEEARLSAERTRAREQAEHEATLSMQRAQAQAEVQRTVKEEQRAQQMEDAEHRKQRIEIEAQALRIQKAAEAETTAQLRQSLDTISEARLRELLLTDTLPRVADSLVSTADTAFYSGESGPLSAGMVQILGALQHFGVRLPGQTED